MIPVIQPLHNSSVDFVRTIGRLYFQQKDHKNLARKIIAHFLEHVRNTYNISTSVLDEAFITKLSYKSGISREEIQELAYEIKYVEESPSITEDELLSLSKRIEKLK
jgi:predicted nucleic acid-binding protein